MVYEYFMKLIICNVNIISCELILDCVLYILISTDMAVLLVFIDVLAEISIQKMPAFYTFRGKCRHFSILNAQNCRKNNKKLSRHSLEKGNLTLGFLRFPHMQRCPLK